MPTRMLYTTPMSSPDNRLQTPDIPPSGILIIDKPSGWTSHDVVNKVRRIFNTKKVGHAGTLDPLATGVLIVLVGKATKLSDQLLSQDKTYQATIKFGQQTDTADADGTVIDTADATRLTETDIKKILPELEGTRQQTAPAYSAIKVNGQKLYNLARAGKPIETLPIRIITINKITLDTFDPTPPFPTATITVTCSKGTYIRVLAEEIAQKLNTLAHLTQLRRLASGPHSIDHSITLAELQQSSDPAQHLIQQEG